MFGQYVAAMICLLSTVTNLVVQLHGLNVHQYADDTQIYGCCHPDNSASLCGDFGICVEDVARWMCSSRLQLNARKTEFMWCVPPRRRHQLPVDQLTILQSPRANRSVTSACTWTATCQCTNTSRSWSVCVTAFCVNFVASVVRYHVQH